MTRSNKWKEVDQHVVLGTVDQGERGGEILGKGLAVAGWDGPI